MSLMVIGETLSNAKARILKQVGFEARGWSGDPSAGWGTPTAVIEQMLNEGWCPRTIRLLKIQLRHNATALLSAYASHQDRHFTGHQEAGCTEKVCKVISNHPLTSDKYATQHHPDCYHFRVTSDPCWPKSTASGSSNSMKMECKQSSSKNGEFLRKEEQNMDREASAKYITCDSPCHVMIGPDIDEVIRLVNEGKIPLLKFIEKAKVAGDRILELTDTTQSTNYATISHVWYDGYGNEYFNRLYRCQLEYFRRLLTEAQAHQTRNRRGDAKSLKKPLPFWIDTLLIPVQNIDEHKAARRKAILQINAVFSKARYTIVIDNGLNKLDWDHNSYTTTGMQIFASEWMRRLWTLQEAYLSRKIMFAFRKCGSRTNMKWPLVDLDDIEALYDDEDDGLVSNLSAIARNYYKNMLGPDRKVRIDKSAHSHGTSLIASVWRAAQWKTMEHKENETLALATLLNLDPSNKSAGVPDLLAQNEDDIRIRDKMMRDFWTLLEKCSPGAIPPGIIFLAGTRISISGFGWAPRSWMSADKIDYPDPIAMIAKPAKLLSTREGLEVEYPGFLLHYENRSAILPVPDGKGFWFPSDNSLTEFYHVTNADYKSHNNQRGNSREHEELAIILSHPRPGQIPEIGLLVKVETVRTERSLGQDDVQNILVVHMLSRVKVQRETREGTLKSQKQAMAGRLSGKASQMIYGETLEENQRWQVDCPPSEIEKQVMTATQALGLSGSQQEVAPMDRPIYERAGIDTDEQYDDTASEAVEEQLLTPEISQSNGFVEPGSDSHNPPPNTIEEDLPAAEPPQTHIFGPLVRKFTDLARVWGNEN